MLIFVSPIWVSKWYRTHFNFIAHFLNFLVGIWIWSALFCTIRSAHLSFVPLPSFLLRKFHFSHHYTFSQHTCLFHNSPSGSYRPQYIIILLVAYYHIFEYNSHYLLSIVLHIALCICSLGRCWESQKCPGVRKS